eukprot:6312706-Prymnesium_polylepis.1
MSAGARAVARQGTYGIGPRAMTQGLPSGGGVESQQRGNIRRCACNVRARCARCEMCTHIIHTRTHTRTHTHAHTHTTRTRINTRTRTHVEARAARRGDAIERQQRGQRVGGSVGEPAAPREFNSAVRESRAAHAAPRCRTRAAPRGWRRLQSRRPC